VRLDHGRTAPASTLYGSGVRRLAVTLTGDALGDDSDQVYTGAMSM
jgi:hypothetical protein